MDPIDKFYKKLALVKKGREEKDKTSVELFYEAEELVNTLSDLLEEALDAYDNAKEMLFVEAKLMKPTKMVDQLK